MTILDAANWLELSPFQQRCKVVDQHGLIGRWAVSNEVERLNTLAKKTLIALVREIT